MMNPVLPALRQLVVVHCRPEVQLERLMARDGRRAANAEQRMGAQMRRKKKDVRRLSDRYFRRLRQHPQQRRSLSKTEHAS